MTLSTTILSKSLDVLGAELPWPDLPVPSLGFSIRLTRLAATRFPGNAKLNFLTYLYLLLHLDIHPTTPSRFFASICAFTKTL